MGTSSVLGVVFICSSLALDGVTGGVQDSLKAKCKELGKKAKPYEMMFWTNFFMMLVAIAVSFGLGEVATGSAYIMENVAIMSKVAAFGACSAIGQSFIFFLVSEYGPLKNATVTTTRKIFSVLLSIFLKGHALATMGWVGIALGAIGIIGELIPEGGKKDEKKEVKKNEKDKEGKEVKKPESKKEN